MESTLVTWVGLTAGTCTTISFVPQVAHIMRTRRAEDVSGLMFAIFSLGVLLWLIYGLSIRSLPVIVANLITLMLSLSVLWLKWQCRPRR